LFPFAFFIPEKLGIALKPKKRRKKVEKKLDK